MRELLRGGRIQLGGDRLGRRGGPGAGRVDREWRADHRPHQCGHPTVRTVQRQQPVAARQGRGDPRVALRNTMAQPRNGHGAALPPITRAPSACRERSELRQPDGMGTSQLLRAEGSRADHRILLGQAELAAVVGGRADQHPNRRHGVRSDVLLEVPDGRPRRGIGSAVAVHRGHGGRHRQDRLHRNAQRTRHLRVRRHRDAHCRRRVHDRQQRRHHRTRQGPHHQEPATPAATRNWSTSPRPLRCSG